jgi:membrane-bound ClpP family serine protease
MSWFKRVFGKQGQPLVHTTNGATPISAPSLVGRIARTVTPLRTGGFIELDGIRYEVMSSKGFVNVDTYVRITGKRMGWLTVEPVEEA